MKILIATGMFPPEIGGPATYAALLADEIKRRGDEVVVLPFRDVRMYPRVIRHLVYIWKILSLSRDADLVFTQDPLSTGLPAVLARKLGGKPVVMRVAGDYAWEQACQRFRVTDGVDEFQARTYSWPVELMKSIQRFCVRNADVVLTPSMYFTSIVRGWVGQMFSRDIRTVYNGIDLAAVYEKQGKYPDKTIISAGRLVPWKGFEHLIRVLPKLPDWKLVIAGDGPDKNRLHGIATEAEVADRVTFLGQIPRAELFAHLHRSHVFALCTTFESFSFQLVEAMHVGIPVIAYDVGNLSEIVESGVNGILIKLGDMDAFVKTVEHISSDPTYATSLSEKAHKRAQDFSAEKTFSQLYELFRQVSSIKK